MYFEGAQCLIRCEESGIFSSILPVCSVVLSLSGKWSLYPLCPRHMWWDVSGIPSSKEFPVGS